MRVSWITAAVLGASLYLAMGQPSFGQDDVVVVVGAGGEEEYARQFQQWAAQWITAARCAEANLHVIGPADASATEPEERSAEETAEATDRDSLLATLDRLKGIAADSPNEPAPKDSATQDSAPELAPPLWVVLIGHGTFQQGIANFNLRGPDISAEALAEALDGIERPLVVINNASASGPFLAALSGEGRVIVTATRDGSEQNFARFGAYMAAAIGNSEADLNHDDRVSVLEAYLMAARQTQAFYDTEGRLATEHALIDDNGDGKGTPPDFFHGWRVTATAAEGAEPDGRLALRMVLVDTAREASLSEEQRQRVVELEQRIEQLRESKGDLEPDQYYRQLEAMLVELAEIEVATENELTEP